MDVVDKNLDYFWKFMPHEEGKDASPKQFDEWSDILPQIETMVKYLNANYAELSDEKVKYHHYKNNKGEKKFLGVEIILDNPESVLLGTIRIYYRECENAFYYTFETCIEIPGKSFARLKEARSELNQILTSLGLQKLTHSETASPVLYRQFKKIDLDSFKIFYGKLRQLSRSMCIMMR